MDEEKKRLEELEAEVPALIDYVDGQRSGNPRRLDPSEAIAEEISILVRELEPLLAAFRRLRRESALGLLAHQVYSQSGEPFIREVAKGEANRIGEPTGEGSRAEAQKTVWELLDANSVAVDRLGTLIHLRAEHERLSKEV